MIETLTEEQTQYIDLNAECPDCKTGRLLIGPRGGACINVRCDYSPCHHEFNITLFRGTVAHAERVDTNRPDLFQSRAVLARLPKERREAGLIKFSRT